MSFAFGQAKDADLSQYSQALKQSSPYFIENKGQWQPEIRFAARLGGMKACIMQDGTVFDFEQIYGSEPDRRIKGHVVGMSYDEKDGKDVVHLRKIKGMKKLDYYHNYFIGNDKSKWQSHVPLYEEVLVENAYEGIDLRYYFDKGMLRYDFIVKPGAALDAITMNYDFGKGWGSSLSLNEAGELIMRTSLGDIVNQELFAYQVIDGEKQSIDCSFNLIGSNDVGFIAGDYDTERELVIDPLVWSTFISSEGNQVGLSVKAIPTVQPTGAYVCGYTEYSGFKTCGGAYDDTFNGNKDCFLTKVYEDATDQGNNLEYSTFFGDSQDDVANDMCVYYSYINSDWRVYLTGYTYSVNFPIEGATIFDDAYNDEGDVFIAAFDFSGDLIKSTFIGGEAEDIGTGIGVYAAINVNPSDTLDRDTIDVVVIVGYTQSDNYPVTVDPAYYPTDMLGDVDGIISLINTDLLTDYGGQHYNAWIPGYTTNAVTKLYGLDINPNYENNDFMSGQFFIVGSTDYSDTLYMESGRIGKRFSNLDCIVLNATRYNGPFATYGPVMPIFNVHRIGGCDDEEGKSIKYSPLSTYYEPVVYLTGYTTSLDFAGTDSTANDSVNVLSTVRQGIKDAFVARLHYDAPPNVNILIDPKIGFYGYPQCETEGNSIAIRNYNGMTNEDYWRINIAGTITSQNGTSYIQPVNEIDNSLNYKEGKDAFIASFKYNLDETVYHAYYGGSGDDEGLSLDMSYYTEVYFTGKTLSSDYPVILNSYNPINETNNNNCYVSKIAGMFEYEDDCTITLKSPANNSYVDPAQNVAFNVSFDAFDCLGDNIGVKIEIQISEDEDFTNPMRFVFNRVTSPANYTVGEQYFEENKIYYWRVLAFTPGVSFRVSSVWKFATSYLSIELTSGWNQISSNVLPVEPNVEAIMSGIEERLVVMEDLLYYEDEEPVCSTYIPGSANNIGDWDIFKSYHVYISQGNNIFLDIAGVQVNPEEPEYEFNLDEDWHWISFLSYEDVEIACALQGIAGSFYIVINGMGELYIPEYSINQIGDMEIGQGYEIYMLEEDSFNYPQNDCGRKRNGGGENEISQMPEHLIPQVNTTGNHSVMVLFSDSIPDNWEIGVWNGNWELIGSGRMQNGRTAITIWGDNEMTENADGALPFEELTLKAYNYQAGRIQNVYLSNIHEITRDTVLNELCYRRNAVYTAGLEADITGSGIFNLTSIPNPLQVSTEITYTLPESGTVTLTISDNLGNVISTLFNNEYQSVGSHLVQFNASNVQNGIYHCTLISGENTETIQLLIVQ